MNYNQNNSAPINNNQETDTSYNANNNVNTRPTGDTRSRKDFKKILGRSDEQPDEDPDAAVIQEEGEEQVVADDSVNVLKKKGPPSLFELTSGKAPAALPMRASPSNDTKQTSSPRGIYDQLMAGKKQDPFSGDTAGDTADANASSNKGKFTTRFGTEQTDLSYVNPMAALSAQQVATQVVGKQERLEPAVNLQVIIDQLVEKAVELKVNDRTETTITLKQPPMFEGANIVLTSFDSAKGEFNISFQNLTQQAKNILDMQVNRDSLLTALDKKGYNVHIITTTTLNELKPIVADAQPTRDPDRDQRGRQRHRHRDNPNDEA